MNNDKLKTPLSKCRSSFGHYDFIHAGLIHGQFHWHWHCPSFRIGRLGYYPANHDKLVKAVVAHFTDSEMTLMDTTRFKDCHFPSI